MPGDIIKLAGGISIFDDIEAGWATPSWEEVVERDPDVILILEYTGDDVADKKEFLETNEFTKDLRAVKEGKIFSVCCSDMQGSAGSASRCKSNRRAVISGQILRTSGRLTGECKSSPSCIVWLRRNI